MEDKFTRSVIGAAIAVHKELGPGLLESVYRKCLAYELRCMQYRVQEEVFLPITYKGVDIDNSFRIDLVVSNQLVIELKTVERLLPVHSAQIISYLKMSKLKKGLLMNFNVPILKQGIKRFSN